MKYIEPYKKPSHIRFNFKKRKKIYGTLNNFSLMKIENVLTVYKTLLTLDTYTCESAICCLNLKKCTYLFSNPVRLYLVLSFFLKLCAITPKDHLLRHTGLNPGCSTTHVGVCSPISCLTSTVVNDDIQPLISVQHLHSLALASLSIAQFPHLHL